MLDIGDERTDKQGGKEPCKARKRTFQRKRGNSFFFVYVIVNEVDFPAVNPCHRNCVQRVIHRIQYLTVGRHGEDIYGKRRRRQDEIGTPSCVTIDFETLENGTVTVRERDSMQQIRVSVEEAIKYIEEKLEF